MEEFSTRGRNLGYGITNKEKVSKVIPRYTYELNFKDEFFFVRGVACGARSVVGRRGSRSPYLIVNCH